jgi:hypothetical protein
MEKMKMPNHCENDLWLHGPLSDQSEFVCFVQSPILNGRPGEEVLEFNYETVFPYPQRFVQIDEEAEAMAAKLKLLPKKEQDAWYLKNGWPKDGYNSGGYDWCVSTWGTKWNAYNLKREIRKKSTFYTWQSAWAPPIPVIAALAAKFPKLRLTHKFYECGMAFKGVHVYENGVRVLENEGHYSGHRGG